MKKQRRIAFRPIPQRGAGQLCLSIYPPGMWFDDPGFVVFLGGCGHGSVPTLSEAKTKLLEHAKDWCKRAISEAEKEIKHYQKQLKKLEEEGLGEQRIETT